MQALSRRSVAVLTELLDGEDLSLRFKVAQMIIEHQVGKPKQAHEHTGSEGEPLTLSHLVRIIHDHADQS